MAVPEIMAVTLWEICRKEKFDNFNNMDYNNTR